MGVPDGGTVRGVPATKKVSKWNPKTFTLIEMFRINTLPNASFYSVVKPLNLGAQKPVQIVVVLP